MTGDQPLPVPYLCVCGHDLTEHQPARRRGGHRFCRVSRCSCLDWTAPAPRRPWVPRPKVEQPPLIPVGDLPLPDGFRGPVDLAPLPNRRRRR